MAKIHTPIPLLKLNDGTSMPMLGYGIGTAWYKRGDASKIDQNTIDAIKMAIKLDYTHIDGAEVYNTEIEQGKAIKECGVPREKLYVATKVVSVDDIPGALKKSLKNLQLDYVDIFYIHTPKKLDSDAKIQAAWKQMEELKEQGLTKSIAVSNFLPKHLKPLLETAKVKPVANQIEFHPYLQHHDLLEFHKQHDIATVAYGPLTAVTKATDGPADPVLQGLAKKYAVNPGDICLRWCIDQDIVPITTSSKEQRLSDYLRACTFKLTPVEIKDLKEAGEKKHFRGFWTEEFDPNDRS